MGKNWYQRVRTQVKRNLRLVTDAVGMEYAIRAKTPLSVDETQAALGEYLAERGFHVIHETDVTAIHNHYDIEYPEYRILKVVQAESFDDCPMASSAVRTDPATSAILPPGVVIYDAGGKTYVSAVRPSTLLAVFEQRSLRETIVDLETVLWTALAEGLPEGELLSTEPPVGQDPRRRRIKSLLHLVVSLVDAEFHMEVSSPEPVHEVKASLRTALGRRGQKVVGEVADGDIMLVVNPGQAHKALSIDPDVGVFAPLSVSVYREDGRTHVRAVRPSTLLIFFPQRDMQDVLLEMEMLVWNGLVAGVPDVRVESRQPPLQPEGGQRTTAANTAGTLGAMREDIADTQY